MRLVISQFMSLDGVVQAPGGPEEDVDGGFPHGGWSMPYFDRTLIGAGLVDEYRLLIEPVLLGGGKTVFPTDGEKRPLELVRTTTAGSGVLCCVYRPGQPPTPHWEG